MTQGGRGQAVTPPGGADPVLEPTLGSAAGWGSAPSPWPWRWAPSSCCPSPSSATRCCSASPTTTTSSGSAAPLSTVGARGGPRAPWRAVGRGLTRWELTPRSPPPSRPLELGLPLLQSVPRLPHALCLLLHRVGGVCGIQEGRWPCGCLPRSPRLRLPPNVMMLPQGIMARVYETLVVLLLLTLLVLGMVWVASAIVGNDAASRQSLYGGCYWGAVGASRVCWGSPGSGRDQAVALRGRRGARCHRPDPGVSADLWEYYLPYLYSCISLFGVLLLLCESWDLPLWHPGPGAPSCAGSTSHQGARQGQRLLPATGAGVWRSCGAGLRPRLRSGPFWGHGEGLGAGGPPAQPLLPPQCAPPLASPPCSPSRGSCW